MTSNQEKYILSQEIFKEQYEEAAADIRVRTNLVVKEGCEGRFENLWNQAFKQIVEAGWDVTGRDKKANQYIQGMKSFTTYLANETKITKLKNYKNNDVIEFERTLIDNNYSVSTIKPYMSGVQAFHSDFLESGGTKNKIQDAATIHQRVELPKRQNGTLDRAWTDREYEEFLKKAKEDGRNDIFYGFKMGDEFGIRIQTIGRLTLKQVNKALEDGYLRVKEKGGKWRNIPIENDKMRQTLLDLKIIAKTENLKSKDHIFRDSDFFNEGKKTQGDNSHDKTVKSIQNYIGNNRDDIQDSDRKNISEYASSKEKRIVEKTELSFHGLRYRYAQRQMDKFLRLGHSYGESLGMTAHLMGHERGQISRIYLCQKNANDEIQMAA
ncbi:tyrosine-type recombinase/integrase [Clostridium perfringens]|nr:integrase domain-containing protein [Clostridium perfringens]